MSRSDASRADPRHADDVVPFRRIAFIGFGLIGGSMAMALRAWERDRRADGDPGTERADQRLVLRAWTPDGVGPSKALERGILDAAPRDPLEALDGVDLVVLAGPADAILRSIDALAGSWAEASPDVVVTDVGSTKRQIVARAHAAGLRFVGGHPMAGRTVSGVDGASAALFADRPWVLVTDHVATADLEALASLVRATRAEPVSMTAELHDAAVAAVSHVPLLASVALVEALAGELLDSASTARLAATGWHGATRLAAGSPAMAAGITATNRDEILPRLRALRDRLDAWVTMLEREAAPADAEREAEPAGAAADADLRELRERFEAARERLAMIDARNGSPS